MKIWKQVIIYGKSSNYIIIISKNWAQLSLPYRTLRILPRSLHLSRPIDVWVARLFIMTINFFCFSEKDRSKAYLSLLSSILVPN